MAQERSARAINQREKTYSTDRENEVSKTFIISLTLIGGAEKKLSKLAGRTIKYGPQN